MYDPPRKGVADAISLLQSGGVQIVMITGDAEETALSIAKSLGLRRRDEPERVPDGRRARQDEHGGAERARGKRERVCTREPEA